MSHQDKEDLRTPLAELKDLLAPIQKLRLKQIPRQGNAELNLTSVAMMALLAFGWSQKSTLGERFDFAHDATKRGLPSVKTRKIISGIDGCAAGLRELIASGDQQSLDHGSRR